VDSRPDAVDGGLRAALTTRRLSLRPVDRRPMSDPLPRTSSTVGSARRARPDRGTSCR